MSEIKEIGTMSFIENIKERESLQTLLARRKLSGESAHIYIHIPFCDSSTEVFE